MSGGVEEKRTLFHSFMHFFVAVLQECFREFHGILCWIQGMMIPSFQKNIGLFKLKKEAVESKLGKPVNKIQNIFKRVSPLNADASVAQGGSV